MQIRNGRIVGAEWKPSPNHNRNHQSRECIVLHYTAGYTLESAVSTFLSPTAKASAHFVVGTDGAIVQMVNGNDTAWHSGYGVYRGGGQVNQRAIGIEIVNPGYHFRSTGGQILNWERKPIPEHRLAPFPGMLEARDPWVGSATTLWPLFPEVQLQAVEKLLGACLAAYPSITDIVGHRDVDSARRLKVDPGPAFPMLRMRMLLNDRVDPRDLDGRRGRMLTITTKGSTLNVRGGPGTLFETLSRGPLPNGMQVEELEVRGDWVLVRVGDGNSMFEGWCFGAYLRPT